MLVEPHIQLPPGSELPSSDETPVDNENQNFIPNCLLFLLERIWQERQDWYFGVDMAVHHTTGPKSHNFIVPDGFLSVGVPRRRESGPRLNYTIWEENNIVPQLVLEVVSKTYNHEYERLKPKDPDKPDAPDEPGKLGIYERIGVPYYGIYNPQYWRRNRHDPLEIYKLVSGCYQQQAGEPYWMPEIGLALGRCQVATGGLDREVLSWFDERGDRFLFSEELVERERQRRERAEARLRELGIDPEKL